MKHAVNPHARRMKEDAKESARLTEVARKRDAARRVANAEHRQLVLARSMIVVAQDYTARTHAQNDALRYVVSMIPDAIERKAVAAMGFLARLCWALGVALTGRFRWQREDNAKE